MRRRRVAGAGGDDGQRKVNRRVRRYLTANLTKILVLVASAARATAAPRLAADVARLCLKVEKAYKHAVSNPFYNPGSVRSPHARTRECVPHPSRFGTCAVADWAQRCNAHRGAERACHVPASGT